MPCAGAASAPRLALRVHTSSKWPRLSSRVLFFHHLDEVSLLRVSGHAVFARPQQLGGEALEEAMGPARTLGCSPGGSS